jgi:hypothetical protein
MLVGGGCGSGGGSSTPTGTVTTSLSDPAPCTNQYSHVWVTISDVQAQTSPDATGGFTDLTPGLAATPMQIDLMNLAATECTLEKLGSSSGIPAGKYQQIRLVLMPNVAPPAGVTAPNPNACVTAGQDVFNCVVLSASSVVVAMTTPSGSVKIPPGQIAQGGLTVPANQAVDLDIDFNACMSVVEAGQSGKFLLKPTLRAGELSTNPVISGTVVQASINGSVVTPSSTGVGNAHVWLEQPSSTYTVGAPGPTANTAVVENLVQTTSAASTGAFEFCPVMAGTYEIVADTELLPLTATPSAATIAANVQVTSSGGPTGLVIPLAPQSTASAAFVTIAGVVATENVAAAGDNVLLSGTQPFTPAGAGGPVFAQIPYLLSSSSSTTTAPVPPAVTTSSQPVNTNCPSIPQVSCPGGSNCACFDLAAPAGNPIVGVANTTGSGYSPPVGGSIEYAIGAIASVSGGAATDLVCANPMMITAPLAVSAGTSPAPNPTLTFAGCD